MDTILKNMDTDLNHLSDHYSTISHHFEQIKGSFKDVIESANVNFFKSKATVALDSTEIDRIIKRFGEYLTELKKMKGDFVNEVEKFEAPFRNHADIVNQMQASRLTILNLNYMDGSQTKTLINLLKFGPTNWKLLYSGSRDGFGSKDFHSRCDYKSPTLTIIKSENGNIFGGYTEALWNENYNVAPDPKTFLFSLINEFKTPCKILSNHQGQIIGCSNNGPVFGKADICIGDNSNTGNVSSSNFPSYYQKPTSIDFGNKPANSFFAGADKFKVLEIEVFQRI